MWGFPCADNVDCHAYAHLQLGHVHVTLRLNAHVHTQQQREQAVQIVVQIVNELKVPRGQGKW